ncbi:hypothetical protein JCGZ_21872 [Jatropha curcas]|uniref:protein-serine/threonine phosphatase n=2 Tax=Jatropha curcas TaxID=180498 RepID=A0A067JC26_JATCU|nr:hypothetical protein JCGZ_21872 [Jatropha curcas]
MEYDNGGAPAVYSSPECQQWVLSSTASLQNRSLQNCQFSILQGRREYQEDAIACNLYLKLLLPGKNGLEEDTVGIIAVFDGHGGQEASKMASHLLFDYFHVNVVFQSYKKMAQHRNALSSSSDYRSFQLAILKEALSKTISDIDLSFSQEAITNNFFSGSTAVVVLLFDGQILVANVGDSKALLLSDKISTQTDSGIGGDSTVHISATALTDDHHPVREDERARIEAAGGSVIMRGVPRVNGVLAMSRSIGDVYLKRYGVIPEPEFTGWRLLTANDIYLVVASDGIFESLTQQDIGDLIFECNSHLQGSQDSKLSHSCLSSTSIADCIVNTAYDKGSYDNLSAIVVPLRQIS